MTVTTFAEFALIEALQTALAAESHITPTPIQAEAIPHLLAGRDVLGTAQTGTGKTAAFALPILQKLGQQTQKSQPNTPRVLVLSPTRELALQIAKRFAAYGRNLKLRIACIFGGVPHAPQIKVLTRGVHVLIACPGRLLDLMDQGEVKLDKLEVFVLDEVDRMLDMGFKPSLDRILAELPEVRQSVFFSATMSTESEEIANRLLKEPVRIAVTPEVKTVEAINQEVMLVERGEKRALLCHILKQVGVERVLVFVRRREDAQRLADELKEGGYRAAAIHADKSQAARQTVLERFRDGMVKVLVATDVAARGLDIAGITHVINYELPQDPEIYVHRIGRTGRAGAIGRAISFCGRREQGLLMAIERQIGQAIEINDQHPYAVEFDHESGREVSQFKSRDERKKPVETYRFNGFEEHPNSPYPSSDPAKRKPGGRRY